MHPLHKSSSEQLLSQLVMKMIQLFLYPQILLTGDMGRKFRIQTFLLPFQLQWYALASAGIYRVCKITFQSNPSFFRTYFAIDFQDAHLMRTIQQVPLPGFVIITGSILN